MRQQMRAQIHLDRRPDFATVVERFNGAAQLLSASVSGGTRLVLDSIRHPVKTADTSLATVASVWRTAGPRHPGSEMLRHRGTVRELITHQVPLDALHHAGQPPGGHRRTRRKPHDADTVLNSDAADTSRRAAESRPLAPARVPEVTWVSDFRP